MNIEWPDLRRCCFCLPLRQGVLVFGYTNVVACVAMVSLVLCGLLGSDVKIFMGHIIHFQIPLAIVVILYSLEFIFNIVLVYGIHMKQIILIKIYFYFMISTFVTGFILEVVELSIIPFMWEWSILLYVATFLMNMYLLILVRSLIRKMEISEMHSYGNQLQQIVNGELIAEPGDQYKVTLSDKEIE